ncbi:hypothetical protein F4677DRAFT_442460 [Hypoxylon crocopeplum]|nr:hypothetical protein F4677DRAFT_442460 [Hypoxylon crocopeplum]
MPRRRIPIGQFWHIVRKEYNCHLSQRDNLHKNRRVPYLYLPLIKRPTPEAYLLGPRIYLQSSSTSDMARFFAALLAAAAMLQVGSAAPYPYTNGTAPAAPVIRSESGFVNSTVANQILKRRLRDFPIALARP